MTGPGNHLHRWARRILPRRAIEHLIDPAIADMQWEHEQALRDRRPWRGRWLLCLGYWGLVKIIALATMHGTWHGSRAALHGRGAALGRVAVFSLVWTTVLAVAFVWPPYSTLRETPLSTAAPLRLWLLLLPQALGVALPVGFFFGVVSALRGSAPSTRARRETLALSTLCASLTFAVLAAVPASNQSFRLLASGLPALEKGPSELTLSELSARARLLEHRPGFSREVRALRFTYHARLVLGTAPVALGLLALGLAAFRRSSATMAGVVIVLYSVGWIAVAVSSHPPRQIVFVWLPNLVCATAGLALLNSSRRRAA
jgi:hypothetical protein